MSENQNTSFISLCAAGELLLDDIDDVVDDWHQSETDQELREYLGMTRQEYRLWVLDPDILPFIITARTQGRLIDDVMADSHNLPLAARADSPASARSLMKWLKESGILSIS